MHRPSHDLEVRSSSGESRRLPLDAVVVVGRTEGDLIIDDRAVSGRHLRLDGTGPRVIAEDLDSSNGTFVNGRRIASPTELNDGDHVVIGDTTLVISTSSPESADTESRATIAPTTTPSAPQTSPVRPPRPRGDFEVVTRTGIEVRYLSGGVAERLAKSYARRAEDARRALTGLGSEAWGTPALIFLVDPFPDPAAPDRLVADGAIVDGDAYEIWIPVTAESPPENPHRSLALLFGEVLPASPDVGHLLEGYGLHVAGVEGPEAQLAGQALPPIEQAEGDIRSAMALSFVRYLIDRENEETFRRLLASPSGRLEDTFQKLYGKSSTALEFAWQQEVRLGEPDVKPGQFLKLSLRYLRPYRARQAELFVWMLLSLAFTAAFPFISRRLLDTAIPSGEFSQVLELLIILTIAFTISLLAGLRQTYQAAWISGAVVRDIRMEMFDRMQRLPTSWYQRYQQGEVLQRMFGDVHGVEAGLSELINTGIAQSLSLVVGAIIMINLNPLLGVIVLAAAPVIAIVYSSMSKGAQTRSMAVQEENGQLLSVAAENYSANPVVKAFQLAHREQRRFGRASDRLFTAQRRLTLFGGFFGLSVNMIVTLLRLFVLGLAGWLILEGRFTIGGLLAFLSIMGEVLSPVTALTGLGQTLQSSMGALTRVNEVLETAPEEADDAGKDPLPVLQDRLELRNLVFSYTPERRALDEMNATIDAGSRVAFVGPSGSGKSTVLRMIMRMYDPDEGAVLIDGVDVRSATLDSLRAQTAVVFQDSFLFDATIRENIAMGKPDATDAEVEAAADAAEIDQFVNQLARGYDTLVGEGGSNLSGGQRQRVSIARALIRDPKLLLLDEATSALDPRTERQLNDTLARVATGRTTVAITHRLASVTDYDRIFVIVDGRLHEQGTHDELVANADVYARLWAEQTGVPVPEEAQFDAPEALGRIPLFRGLDMAVLEDIAARMSAFTLEAGDAVRAGDGRLMMVARGRGQVLSHGIGDGDVVTSELAPGDVFGLNALLGQEGGSSMQAVEKMTVLALNDEAVRAVAAQHPIVAAALSGETEAAAAPHGGQRLARTTIATGAFAIDDIARTSRSLPNPDVRRMTGSIRTGTYARTDK